MAEREYLGKWTMTKLTALTPRARFDILEKTRNTRLGTPETRSELIDAITVSGAIFDSSAITNDDPMTLAMEAIVNSPAGRAACLNATLAGLPALAEVEPMIVEACGELYGQKHMATQQAGAVVGRKQIPMPPASVAKTATLWKK